MQLAKAQGLTPTPDDNKNGENKREGEGEPSTTVQISKVLIPAITTSPPIQIKGKLDGIDLIQIAAAELQVKEQRRKIDEKVQQIFGSTASKSQSVKHSTKVESIIMELKPVRRNKVGETSAKNMKPMVLKPNNRSNKDSTKNSLSLAQMREVDFPLPKPDEHKVPAKPNYSLVLYFAANRPINGSSLLGQFVDETDLFRDSRFKLIPNPSLPKASPSFLRLPSSTHHFKEEFEVWYGSEMRWMGVCCVLDLRMVCVDCG
ncbi:hypothetical protein AgCh_002093 [Apium graveolens]